jgi:hypothetical protein
MITNKKMDDEDELKRQKIVASYRRRRSLSDGSIQIAIQAGLIPPTNTNTNNNNKKKHRKSHTRQVSIITGALANLDSPDASPNASQNASPVVSPVQSPFSSPRKTTKRLNSCIEVRYGTIQTRPRTLTNDDQINRDKNSYKYAPKSARSVTFKDHISDTSTEENDIVLEKLKRFTYNHTENTKSRRHTFDSQDSLRAICGKLPTPIIPTSPRVVKPSTTRPLSLNIPQHLTVPISQSACTPNTYKEFRTKHNIPSLDLNMKEIEETKQTVMHRRSATNTPISHNSHNSHNDSMHRRSTTSTPVNNNNNNISRQNSLQLSSVIVETAYGQTEKRHDTRDAMRDTVREALRESARKRRMTALHRFFEYIFSLVHVDPKETNIGANLLTYLDPYDLANIHVTNSSIKNFLISRYKDRWHICKNKCIPYTTFPPRIWKDKKHNYQLDSINKQVLRDYTTYKTMCEYVLKVKEGIHLKKNSKFVSVLTMHNRLADNVVKTLINNKDTLTQYVNGSTVFQVTTFTDPTKKVIVEESNNSSFAKNHKIYELTDTQWKYWIRKVISLVGKITFKCLAVDEIWEISKDGAMTVVQAKLTHKIDRWLMSFGCAPCTPCSPNAASTISHMNYTPCL